MLHGWKGYGFHIITWLFSIGLVSHLLISLLFSSFIILSIHHLHSNVFFSCAHSFSSQISTIMFYHHIICLVFFVFFVFLGLIQVECMCNYTGNKSVWREQQAPLRLVILGHQTLGFLFETFCNFYWHKFGFPTQFEVKESAE